MNLRGSGDGAVADVEDLRRQIESALGNVDEIVKNNGVINVATSADATANGISAKDEDEMIVYVSIKLNKNDSRFNSTNDLSTHQTQSQHPIENHVDYRNNGSTNGHNTMAVQDRIVKKVNMNGEAGGGVRGLRDEMTKPQVTGQAIKPKRRGKGGGGMTKSMSVTAPTTPVRGAMRTGQLLRSKSVEHGPDGQSRSYEVNICTGCLSNSIQ